MKKYLRSFLVVAILLTFQVGFNGCNRNNLNKADAKPDTPRLTANVRMQDVTFYSVALKREMQYRVIFPAKIASQQKLQTVYLLHGGGGGGGFRDWSNYSDVAAFAECGLLLVMPEGNSSYYTNSATRPEDRYEDYIIADLIADIESKFPVSKSPKDRAIAGVSMGGYGAIKIAIRHPGLFAFAAGISPAVDVPTRPFSIKRIEQWRFHSSIFGPSGSSTRRENDPFQLVRTVDASDVPYLYLTCGDAEGLLASNRALADLLTKRQFKFEFHVVHGGHDWTQWKQSIPGMFESLLNHLLATGLNDPMKAKVIRP